MTVSTVELVDADDALQFWSPTADVPIDDTHFPWGAVAPGSSDEREFRVRNTSGAYWAGAVVVALGDAEHAESAPSVARYHLLSLDGQRFTATVQLGEIGPGAVSPPLWLRRVTPPDAPPGEGTFVLSATAATWYPAGQGALDDTLPADDDELAPLAGEVDPNLEPVIDP